MEPKLPKHDTIESVSAGDGWHADVAFRGDKLVGVVVVPDDARSIPESLELREVSLSDARGKAHARESGLDFKTAKAAVIAKRRKVPPHGRGKARERNVLVALLVLEAQDRGEDRYQTLRRELPKLGYALGNKDKSTNTVKWWVEASTRAGYLKKKGSGRGPRSPGPELLNTFIRDPRGDGITLRGHVNVTMAVDIKTQVKRAKKGK